MPIPRDPPARRLSGSFGYQVVGSWIEVSGRSIEAVQR